MVIGKTVCHTYVCHTFHLQNFTPSGPLKFLKYILFTKNDMVSLLTKVKMSGKTLKSVFVFVCEHS